MIILKPASSGNSSKPGQGPRASKQTPGGRDTPAHGGVFMKAFIKGGLCLALGWLASAAGAQETAIKWQASAAKNPGPSAVIPPVGNATAKTETGLRPVALNQPIPLDNAGSSTTSFPRSGVG